MRGHHVVIVCVAATATTILPTPASAQGSRQTEAEQAPSDADLARARSLFLQGVEHSDAGRWSVAAARFEEALAIRAAPAIEYNLASALIELGEYQRADRLLRQVLEHPESSEELRLSATNARGDVRARAAELRIRGFGDAAIRVDGVIVPPEEAVRPYFLTPGSHRVELVRGEAVVSHREVEVTPASVTEVPFGPRSGASVPTPGEAIESRSLDPTVAFLVVGSVLTVVAIAAVIAFATSDGAQPFEGLGPDFGGPARGSVFDF